MKARALRKTLNNTKYIVHDLDDCIAIGSPMQSDLISVNKRHLYMNYSLTYDQRDARKRISNPELEFIWDKLKELIDSGKIHAFIDGIDEIEDPLPVFAVIKGKLLSTTTDKYGYPNITAEGYLMYDNKFFRSKKAAIENEIKNYIAAVRHREEQIAAGEKQLEKDKAKLGDIKMALKYLQYEFSNLNSKTKKQEAI
jgi:hypothetical protein